MAKKAKREARKQKLTKRSVDALRFDPAAPDRRQVLWDTQTPGFGVRVFESGAKSFILTYRAGGRLRQMTVGRYGDFTVEQARAEAEDLRAAVRRGEDPLAAAAVAREAPTMREFARTYLERHAKPHKKTWREDERRINKYIVPAMGALRIADVRRPDVARLHDRIGVKAPYEANRVLALLAVMFSKAEEWGLIEEGTPNPAAKIQTFKERSRDRWITPAEMPLLVEAIDAEPSPYVRAAIKLYLLTGLRRNELLRLRWRAIDLDRHEIHLADTKAGRSHTLPLSSAAEAILRALPRGIGNACVFPGEKPGQRLVNIAKPWRRIRARFWLLGNPVRAAELRARAEHDVAHRSKHAEKTPEAVEHRLLTLAQAELKGEEDVRLHDLRRTVGSWLATNGASLPLIGKVLNHSNASTTQVYAHLAEDATRTALEEHGSRIGPILGITGDGEGRTATPTGEERQ